jgi:6-phosphogluconolactonase (cycloisomerase 2 family)
MRNTIALLSLAMLLNAGCAHKTGVQFAYVANFYAGNVSAYKVNATSGALTEVSGSPFKAGTDPMSIAVTSPH